MSKKITIIVVIFFIGVFFLNDNWLKARLKNDLGRFYFTWQALFATQAVSPEAAYEGFRQALSNSSTEANKYLSPEAQKAYRFVLANQAKKAMILAWPEKMTKLYQEPCSEEDYCLEQAVYRLDYYQPSTEVEFDGRLTTIVGGPMTREIVFIKRADGKWWIKKL